MRLTGNKTSFTKPEVHTILHDYYYNRNCTRGTHMKKMYTYERRKTVTGNNTENFVMFAHVIFEIHEQRNIHTDRQTDRQTDRHTQYSAPYLRQSNCFFFCQRVFNSPMALGTVALFFHSQSLMVWLVLFHPVQTFPLQQQHPLLAVSTAQTTLGIEVSKPQQTISVCCMTTINTSCSKILTLKSK